MPTDIDGKRDRMHQRELRTTLTPDQLDVMRDDEVHAHAMIVAPEEVLVNAWSGRARDGCSRGQHLPITSHNGPLESWPAVRVSSARRRLVPVSG